MSGLNRNDYPNKIGITVRIKSEQVPVFIGIRSRKCPIYSKCPYLAVFIYPIKIEDEVIGSIALSATNQDHLNNLLSNEKNLLVFTEKMSLLLANTIKEYNSRRQIARAASMFNAVINSVLEGIITTDEKGYITHANKSAIQLLGLGIKDLINTQINKIFPDIVLNTKGYFEKEIVQTKGKKEYYYWCTIVPYEDPCSTVGFTISFRTLRDMQKSASKLLGEYREWSFEQIIGDSCKLVETKDQVKKAAQTDSTVLIRGESGTGKELFARAIHFESSRRNGPFIAINCGGIPEPLLESELFGYDEGAFTGSRKGGKLGKFELANGGTLFLDEIGDMPLHLQVKLLRAIQERTIEHLGGTQPIPLNVRIISATHRNLESMIGNYEFRADLYYRLSVIPVFIPPLRERPKDIPMLTDHFISKYNKIFNRSVISIDTTALKALLSYHWPGNVRELENAIEYAMNMVSGPRITLNCLPAKFRLDDDKNKLKRKIHKPKTKDDKHLAVIKAVERFGNTVEGKRKAAEYLGISLATLYRRLHADPDNNRIQYG